MAPTSSATVTDYLWFQERFPDLAQAYCLTLVDSLPPAAVLDRLGGRAEQSRTGVAAVVDEAFDLLERTANARQFIAMTTVGSWTLLIEPCGFPRVDEEQALPASAGTRWVSHFVSINALSAFLWAEDTTIRLMFDPTVPDDRWGATPDELLEAMHDSGFQFWSEVSETATDLSTPAAFALAERLTGVRITPGLLQEATFSCGSTEIG
ncbi:DUF6461 domain-containing protein [Streptomyces sp. 35G-GA-8]|uniref:DUF6461 domain-containing protein n=1 Tax=Streptomyces sp. 35G-GA-8 TaxID=2939434 RepID=UPI00201F7A7D|nr:DUF6461 domain-containing protein [Streptomyces sp. 35G-GA-8]MCL7380301.1 DUF6461 domain-containing protein [Streptomyces sp. 35G-GA-8]